ncbi:MAG: type 4a pilus biogenesis protein PilO [Candidatus Moranbacteria bacterium]|nr:type 4a pilus biogenesis protein PilO [Candidatus Moranbacteria bacterium]
MSLKILIVPFSILMMLVLTIGFIKPDLGTMEEKRSIVSTKQIQSENMATLLKNIQALEGDLNSRQESEKFVSTYLPKTMDQERVLDMLNYLSGQSGVLMTGLTMKEMNTRSQEEVLLAPDGSSLPSAGGPKTKTFSVEVNVKGSYENIKTFFSQVAHMNRAHKTESFAIKSLKEATGEGASTTILEGVFAMSFDYFPVQKVGSALTVPAFSKRELDTTQLTKALSWVTVTVPALVGGPTGRANPFQ